tara:strand:- start:138 stop:1160 length:1023 start_codon:yes stop_codon:yes gene_type:complete
MPITLIAQVINTEAAYKLTQDDEGNDLRPGTILVRSQAGRILTQTREHYAVPYDVNNIRIPLVGEKVLLHELPSDQTTTFLKYKRYAYSLIINVHDNVNTNVLPFEAVNKAGGAGGAGQTAGISGEGLADPDIQQISFEEKEVIQAQPYEGDMLVQDRFGSLSRFSSTVDGGIYDQPKQPWSGTPGEPIIVLTSGLNTNKGNLYVIEDPEEDKSTIFIASNQKLDIKSSQPKFGPAASAIDTSDLFEGAQVAINSDRLLFNAKADSILLSGAITVAISTPAWAVDMNEFFTLFDDLLITLQKVFSGASFFNTPMGGPTLPNPLALNELMQIITKYKQMTQ